MLRVEAMPPHRAQQHARQDTETETKSVCLKSTALNDAVEGVMHEAPTTFQKVTVVGPVISLINTTSTVRDAFPHSRIHKSLCCQPPNLSSSHLLYLADFGVLTSEIGGH